MNTQNVHHLSETLYTQQKATLALQMLSGEKKRRNENNHHVFYRLLVV